MNPKKFREPMPIHFIRAKMVKNKISFDDHKTYQDCSMECLSTISKFHAEQDNLRQEYVLL